MCIRDRPETAHIPIIFMTGLTDTEHVLAAFEAGGVDYVTKPIRAPEVLARMAAHMQAARQARQARSGVMLPSRTAALTVGPDRNSIAR